MFWLKRVRKKGSLIKGSSEIRKCINPTKISYHATPSTKLKRKVAHLITSILGLFNCFTLALPISSCSSICSTKVSYNISNSPNSFSFPTAPSTRSLFNPSLTNVNARTICASVDGDDWRERVTTTRCRSRMRVDAVVRR